MVLEESFQAFVDAVSIQRRSFWVMGDIIAETVNGLPAEKKSLLSNFAELAHCTTTRITQYLHVSETFPPEKRLPDKPHSLYLKVMQRAKSLGIDPLELLELTLQNDWSERDVMQYMREDDPKISFRKTCPACNSMVAVITSKAGANVKCPICGEALGVTE